MKIDEVIKKLKEFKKQGFEDVRVAIDEEWNAIGEFNCESGENFEDDYGKTIIIYPETPEPTL